jgi:hypothetical protein
MGGGSGLEGVRESDAGSHGPQHSVVSEWRQSGVDRVSPRITTGGTPFWRQNGINLASGGTPPPAPGGPQPARCARPRPSGPSGSRPGAGLRAVDSGDSGTRECDNAYTLCELESKDREARAQGPPEALPGVKGLAREALCAGALTHCACLRLPSRFRPDSARAP